MSDALIQDRDGSRQFFYTVWQKYQDKQPMEPLEQMVLQVVLDHPEYHRMLEQKDYVQEEFSVETGRVNPFLHMGMHITIKEQVSVDRPAGIKMIYEKLLTKTGSEVEAEHMMLDCLGEALWLAQRNNTMPDENWYLSCLKNLIRK